MCSKLVTSECTYIYIYIYIFSDNIMYVLQIDIFTIYTLYLCAIYINTDIWVNDY